MNKFNLVVLITAITVTSQVQSRFDQTQQYGDLMDKLQQPVGLSASLVPHRVMPSDTQLSDTQLQDSLNQLSDQLARLGQDMNNIRSQMRFVRHSIMNTAPREDNILPVQSPIQSSSFMNKVNSSDSFRHARPGEVISAINRNEENNEATSDNNINSVTSDLNARPGEVISAINRNVARNNTIMPVTSVRNSRPGEVISAINRENT